jgi:hypothetical protein
LTTVRLRLPDLILDGYAALAVLAVVVAGVRWYWRRRELGRSADRADVRCGTCGYKLIPGASTVCSECGHDVRTHGLTTDRVKGPPISVGPLATLTVMLAAGLACTVLVPVSRELCPFRWRWQAIRHIEATGVSVSLGADGYGKNFSRSAKYVRISGHGREIDMAYIGVDPPTMTATLRQPLGTSRRSKLVAGPAPFDEAIVGKLIDVCGPDLRDDERRHLLSQVMTETLKLAAADIPPGSHMNGGDFVWWHYFGATTNATLTVAWHAGLSLAMLAYLRRRQRRTVELLFRPRWATEADRVGLVEPMGPSAAMSAVS